jgi:hypothetical protein
VPEADSSPQQRNLVAIGVEPQRHRRARTERGKQQVIRPRTAVEPAAAFWLVRQKLVGAENHLLLKQSAASFPYHDHSRRAVDSGRLFHVGLPPPWRRLSRASIQATQDEERMTLPVEHSLQGLVPHSGAGAALPLQLEPSVEQLGNPLNAISSYPAGHDLDPEGNFVQAPADVHYGRSLRLGRLLGVPAAETCRTASSRPTMRANRRGSERDGARQTTAGAGTGSSSETVSAARDVGYVTLAPLAVAEQLAQPGDMAPQRANT